MSSSSKISPTCFRLCQSPPFRKVSSKAAQWHEAVSQ